MSLNPIATTGWMAAGVVSVLMVAALVGILRISRGMRRPGARWSVAVFSFVLAVLVSSWAVSRFSAALMVARGVVTPPAGSDLFVHPNPITGLAPALIATFVGIWYLVRSRRFGRVT